VSKPQKGDVVRYALDESKVLGTVDHVDTSWPEIVHVREPSGAWDSFIWSFHDGINSHFTWCSKCKVSP
jgi:hypothetical protein